MIRMRKAKKLEERHPPPWIVTYADMITLMFAVFVMLYVLTIANEPDQAARKISEVFSNRFYFFDGGASVEKKPYALDGGSVDNLAGDSNAEGLANIKKLARGVLAEAIRAKNVQITEDERGVIISMISNLYFPPGQTQPSPALLDTLDSLSPFLASLNRYIRVEGFAGRDEENFSFPEGTPSRTTWELSSERALAVIRQLETNGVSSNKLQALSYGAYRPLKNIDSARPGTPEYWAQNRRVDIVILTHKKTKRAPRDRSQGLPETITPQSEYLVPDLPE